LVGKIKYFTETTGITEAEAKYGNNVKMTWLVPELKLAPFQNHIQEISGGSITLAIEKSRWYNA